MKSKLITCLVLLCLGASLYAQKVSVSGTVRDDVGPLIGASVVEKGTTSNGAVTDLDGRFSLSV